MRTFVIRARKGPVLYGSIRNNIGVKGHFEIIAHSIINAFFVSNNFRSDVEVYIVLESSETFPYTIKLSSNDGLSLYGFHEEAIINLFEETLKKVVSLQKDESIVTSPGVEVFGFGFEKCLNKFDSRHIYMLGPKGGDIRGTNIENNPVFLLSDNLPMPKNNIKSLVRKGVNTISLGKRMLFASQIIVLLNYELDFQEFF
ncbi:tRNA (pseudouridine(54)-N(1))-methyltransferase TrmY [Gammaproteobacteria bacterium]|nr:tRNA (pseudouridine(54)-N(1))-methyltransferase TrmY [Gammaproteobacteria bacterium]